MTVTGFDSQNTNMLWCATSHDSACSPFDLFIFFSQFAWHILCCCQLIYRLIPVYWTVYDNPSMCMPTLDSHVTCICIFQCNLFCILWCGGRSMHNAHGMSVWLWVLLMHRKHANHLRCGFMHYCMCVVVVIRQIVAYILLDVMAWLVRFRWMMRRWDGHARHTHFVSQLVWFGFVSLICISFVVCCAVLCKSNKTPKDIRLSLDLFYEQTLSVYVAPLYTYMVDIVRLILSSGWVGVWLEKNNPILIWLANVAELRAPILRHKSMAVFK